MSELQSTNNEPYYYSTVDLFKEPKFLIQILVFSAIYLSILFVGLQVLEILLFPLFLFTLSIFTYLVEKILNFDLKLHSELRFKPFGELKLISHRIYILSIIELGVILLLSADSLYHPQMIDYYFTFYIYIIITVHNFSIFYALQDIGRKAGIFLSKQTNAINKKENNEKYVSISKISSQEFKNLFFQKRNIFLIFQLIWTIIFILEYFSIIPGYNVNLPGSLLVEGVPLPLSYFIWQFLISNPIIFGLFLSKYYNIVKKYDKNALKKIDADEDSMSSQKIRHVLNSLI